MRKLFDIIGHDLDNTTTKYRRDASRVIVVQDGKVALLYSTKEGYYKFLGGGIEPGETVQMALHREVLEECGRKLNLQSITPFGYVEERYKSQVVEGELFESISHYYWASFAEGQISAQFDAYEKTKGLVFNFYQLYQAIIANQQYYNKTGSNMILRELKVMLLVKEILDNQIK